MTREEFWQKNNGTEPFYPDTQSVSQVAGVWLTQHAELRRDTQHMWYCSTASLGCLCLLLSPALPWPIQNVRQSKGTKFWSSWFIFEEELVVLKQKIRRDKMELVSTHQVLAAKQNFYHYKSMHCKYEQKYMEINTLFKKIKYTGSF